MRFQNHVIVRPGIRNVDDDEIRRLPQFFRADAEYVYKLGGSTYRAILDAAPLGRRRRYVSIDSRVHMLMPGFFPCIPGWHCDDFLRTDPPPGQPRFRDISERPELESEHHAILLGKTAATEYACAPITLPDWIVTGTSVYADADRDIESHADGRLGRDDQTLIAPFGSFVSFGALVWHRGHAATMHAWRLFVRITESDHWQPRNEMRTQVQVYLTEPSKGW